MSKRISIMPINMATNAHHGTIIPIPAGTDPDTVCSLIATTILSDIMNEISKEQTVTKNKSAKKHTAENDKSKTMTNETSVCRCPYQNDNVISIESVNYYKPATVIKWSDGTKTVAVCDKEDTYDPQAGFAIAVAKKFMGNAAFHDALVQYVPENVSVNTTEKTSNALATNVEEKSESDKMKTTDAATKKTTKKTTTKKSTTKKTSKK